MTQIKGSRNVSYLMAIIYTQKIAWGIDATIISVLPLKKQVFREARYVVHL